MLVRATLESYATGTISDLDAATIDAHLNECRTCLARLDQLASQPEPLIEALRPAPGLARLRPRLTR
jgi:predicted anti-sigma-YlaC factor YlaD